MLKIFLFILVIASAVFAKSLVFDACTPTYCYVIKTPDAKSWEWKTDYTGSKFIRVYLFDGILDIPAHNLSIKVRK
jgi:hypothetical protein